LFAFSIELLILRDIDCMQTCLFHFLHVFDSFFAHELSADCFLVCYAFQCSSFKGNLRLSIFFLASFGSAPPIARVSLQFSNKFVIVFVNLIVLFSLQLHLVHFCQLCIKALLGANVSEIPINVILVSKLVIQSITIVLDSLVVAISLLLDVTLHIIIVLHTLCSFSVTFPLQGCASIEPRLFISNESGVRIF